MAKFAKDNEKEFNPISVNLIDQVRNDSGIPDMLENDVEYKPTYIEEKQLQNHRIKRERFSKQMRYQVTPTEEKEIKQFLSRISDASGSSPTHSNMMRACFVLMQRAEKKIVEELKRAEIQRPINEQYAITQFEDELADVLHSAFRQIPLRFAGFD